VVKVDGKATIPNPYTRQLYRLLCNQQCQSLPWSSYWENLGLSIVFAASSVAWCAIGNGAAIAANSGTCQSQGKLVPAISLPIEQTNHLLCVATTRSPSGSEITQIVPNDKDSEVAALGQPVATPMPDVRLAEAPIPEPEMKQGDKRSEGAAGLLRIPTHVVEASHLLLPLKVMPPQAPANIEVVPTPEPESKPVGNGKIAEQSDSKPQLKVQQTQFSLPYPESQSELTVEKLDVPLSDGDSELGTLRVRELEVKQRQTDTNSGVDGDSELGKLRVRELEVQPRQTQANPELGILRVRNLEVEPLPTDSDLELGNLRIREQELQTQEQEVQSPRFQTTARLLAQVGYFQTNNIFSGIDPIDDSLFSSGLTLWAAPVLGPKTTLVTAIDGTLIRYLDQSEFNYNQLRFRAGIRQQLTPRMYSEIGWNNQQLFRAGVGDRFLNENSIRLAVQRRDPLNKKLRLDTLYEFRFSDANPETRSRIINSLSVSLSYLIKRNLQVGLDYQFSLSNFTQREREDQYHRLLGRLNYGLSPDSQVSVQGGLTSGGSSQPNIDFDNFFFSVTYTLELGKF
jgi:hypothetical protein